MAAVAAICNRQPAAIIITIITTVRIRFILINSNSSKCSHTSRNVINTEIRHVSNLLFSFVLLFLIGVDFFVVLLVVLAAVVVVVVVVAISPYITFVRSISCVFVRV